MRARPLPILMILTLLFQTGCYNTYVVSTEEFKKIQESDGAEFKSIMTEGGQEITITENSRVGVQDINGNYYPISPFNFTISKMQMIAPDDYDLEGNLGLLIDTKEISVKNVQIVNPTNTALLIGGVAVALIGAAVGVTLLTPDCTGQFCQP